MEESAQIRRQYLKLVMYLLAAYIVAEPLLRLGAHLWPPVPSEAQWRFGALGLIAQTELPLLMGSLTAVLAAHLFGHARVQRVLAWVNGVVAAMLLIGVAVYILDRLQVRPLVEEQALFSYNFSMWKSVFGLLGGAATLGLLSWGGFRCGILTRPEASAPLPESLETT